MINVSRVVVVARHRLAVILNIIAGILAIAAMYNESPAIGVACAVCWTLSGLVDLVYHESSF